MPREAASLLCGLLALAVLCIQRVGGLADTSGWLEGHNRRRAHFHAKYGKQYVPLFWSDDLADGAADYAAYLVGRNCAFRHCRRSFPNGEEDCDFGENLAMNWGWGGPRSAEEVLTAWTEEEESTMGGHYTQVLWRATHYVGCATASGPCGHIQICRYLRPGNCNGLHRYLDDDSPCGPFCPAEGCTAAEAEDSGEEGDAQHYSFSAPNNTPSLAPAPATRPPPTVAQVPTSTSTTPPPSVAAASPPAEAEIFEANAEFDLAFSTLHYDAGSDYAACRSAASQFPVDPADGRPFSLGDDDKATVAFEDDFRFPFFSVNYSLAFVNSNGFLEFVESSGSTHSPAFGRHYRTPKISALFADLVPQLPGSQVSWKQMGRELVAVTFQDVPTYGESNHRNSFQIVLHASGDIDITYLAVEGRKRRLVGLSAGRLPPLLHSVDLSSHYPICEGGGSSFGAMECALGAQSFKFEPSGAGGDGLRALCVDASDSSVVVAQVECEGEYTINHSGDGRIVVTCA